MDLNPFSQFTDLPVVNASGIIVRNICLDRRPGNEFFMG